MLADMVEKSLSKRENVHKEEENGIVTYYDIFTGEVALDRRPDNEAYSDEIYVNASYFCDYKLGGYDDILN